LSSGKSWKTKFNCSTSNRGTPFFSQSDGLTGNQDYQKWANNLRFFLRLCMGFKPVLNGTTKISAWEKAGLNKWETTCKASIEELTNLFINGARQPLGRWPNVTAPNRGYLWVKWSSEQNKLSSQSIPDASRWQGAELVVRNQRWVLDRVPVLATNGDTLTIEPTSYNISTEFGFFVCNHPSTLDKNGEWCFNKKTKKLTLFLETDPSLSVIEASTTESVISIENQNFIVIENLVLRGASSIP